MIDSVLQEIALEAPSDAPVFLIGDFNEPSHLDWTAAAATAGQHFGWAVEWPTSNEVPEPAAADMLLAGVAFLVAAGRRRERNR